MRSRILFAVPSTFSKSLANACAASPWFARMSAPALASRPKISKALPKSSPAVLSVLSTPVTSFDSRNCFCTPSKVKPKLLNASSMAGVGFSLRIAMMFRRAVPACSGLRLPDRSVPRFASVRSMGIFAVAASGATCRKAEPISLTSNADLLAVAANKSVSARLLRHQSHRY